MHNNQITLKISEVLLSSQGQVKIDSTISDWYTIHDVCHLKVSQIAISESKFPEKFQYFKKLFSKILRAPLAARAP